MVGGRMTGCWGREGKTEFWHLRTSLLSQHFKSLYRSYPPSFPLSKCEQVPEHLLRPGQPHDPQRGGGAHLPGLPAAFTRRSHSGAVTVFWCRAGYWEWCAIRILNC